MRRVARALRELPIFLGTGTLSDPTAGPAALNLGWRAEGKGLCLRRENVQFRKLRDDDVAKADVYRHGLSLAAIGRRFGADPATVGKALRRSSVQLRPRRGWASHRARITLRWRAGGRPLSLSMLGP